MKRKADTEQSGKRRLCGHCGDHVSLTTYKRHRNLYYNFETETWTTYYQIYCQKAGIHTRTEAGIGKSDFACNVDHSLASDPSTCHLYVCY